MKISRWPKADLQWYLGVRCAKCRTPILFALDRSDGPGAGKPISAAKLFLTCPSPKCRHQADYSSATVSRFQNAPETAPATKNANESKKGENSSAERR